MSLIKKLKGLNTYDFAIIGAGIGGLTTAAILSKEGYKVALIEKNTYVGGNLSTFKRQGITFDTGVHYTGGFDEGELFDSLFKYLGIKNKIHVQRQNIDCFDKISYMGEEFEFAQGYDLHQEKLSEYFPKYKKEIANYLNAIKQHGSVDNIKALFEKEINLDTLSVNAYTKSKELLKDPKLLNVLTATNALYSGVKEKTPFLIHAHVMDAYIKSSWKFVNGGQHVADALADAIKQNGGEIFLGAEADTFKYSDKDIESIILKSGETIRAKRFITTLHPSLVVKMMPKDKLRKVFRKRILSMENTMSMFSVYLVMKEESQEYWNYNYYHFRNKETWITNIYNKKEWPQAFFMFSQLSQTQQKYADGIVLMAYMSYNEVKKWAGTPVERRGEEYKAFKAEKTEQLLQLVESAMPNFRSKIKSVYSSTPLSYENYYNMPEGAPYGVIRNSEDPIGSTVLPVTKTPNLILSGQSVSLHGAFGVAIGSILTASYFVGKEKMIEKLSAKH